MGTIDQPASAVQAVPPSIIRRPSPSSQQQSINFISSNAKSDSNSVASSGGGAAAATSGDQVGATGTSVGGSGGGHGHATSSYISTNSGLGGLSSPPLLSPNPGSGTGTPSSILLNKSPSKSLAAGESSSSSSANAIFGDSSIDAKDFSRTKSPDRLTHNEKVEGLATTSPGGGVNQQPQQSATGLSHPARAISPHATAFDSGAHYPSQSGAVQQHQQNEYFRPSRSPSPHCHFAPLPKVDQDRPMSRRTSTAGQGSGVGSSSSSSGNRVKPFINNTGVMKDRDGSNTATPASDAHEEPFHLEMGEQLGSALHNLTLGRNSPNLGRRRASRSSSAARSTSPSPVRRPGMSHSSSQTHSPAMSRHASSDAMNVHYIQGTKVPSGAVSPNPGQSHGHRVAAAGVGVGVGAGGPTGRDRDESGSRERIRGDPEHERERELQIEMARLKEREAWKEEREAAARATGGSKSPDFLGAVVNTPGLGSSESTGSGSGDHPPSSSASGVLSNPTKKPMFVEPTAAERIKPTRKNTNEEIVEIEPGQEANAIDTELEEVEEVDEDNVDEENENDDDDDDDDDDDPENDDEDDEDDDKDDENRNDDDDDDDEEEPETEVRATARGAAVEVVHWHRSESPVEDEA